MFSKLLDNPALSIATTVSALMVALNGVVGTLGLPPFWSDALVAVTIGYTAGHWFFHTLKESKRKRRRIGLYQGMTNQIGLRAAVTGLTPSVMIIVVLLGLFAWSATPPARHIAHLQWTLCGTFVGSRQKNSCIVLLDSRGRRISSECLRPDDSGYLYMARPTWWTYRPEAVSLRNDEVTFEPLVLEESMFDRSCEGVMIVQ